MSKVRALDSLHDWTFGKGFNDYKSNQDAVAQNIDTRLNSWLGDCFFDLGAGIDWLNFLSSKDQLGLNLAVTSIISNTDNVIRVNQLFLTLSNTRQISISYNVSTTYGATNGNIQIQLQ